MKTNPHLADDERALAAFYVHNAEAKRLPLDKFSDAIARATIETLSLMDADGASGPGEFSRFVTKLDRLPCEGGRIAADVATSDASTWTPEIAATAEEIVLEAATYREIKQGLRDALKKIEEGAPIEEALAVVPHHAPPTLAEEDEPEDEPEPFPIEALDGLIVGEMAREIARVAQVPIALASAAVLGVASGAMGAGVRVLTWAGVTTANLWFLCVARSGTGKDRALNLAADPIFDLAKRRAAEWKDNVLPGLKTDLRIAKADLSDLEKKIKGTDGAIPELRHEIAEAEARLAEAEDALANNPRLTVGDATKEALIAHLSRQPGEAAFAISAEARGPLDIVSGRYNGGRGDEDLWLAGYSGTPIDRDRVGGGHTHLNRPCIAITWMTQPDSFNRCLARPEMAESGFLPRFLLFDAKARPQRAADFIAPLDASTAEKWRRLIEELVETFRDNGDDPSTLEMEPEALSLLKAYANDTADRRDADLADLDAFAARWAEITCRLALGLHGIEHGADAANRPVSAITATRAHRLVDWFSRESEALLGDLTAAKRRERREKLKDILLENGGEMSLRDLERRHGFRRDEIESILPKIGGRIETKGGARGRPSLVAILPKTP